MDLSQSRIATEMAVALMVRRVKVNAIANLMGLGMLEIVRVGDYCYKASLRSAL
jgi:hypothetical protein